MGDQSVLVIRFYAYFYAYENSWLLEKEDDEGNLVVVDSGDYQTNNLSYKDTVCLEPDTTYVWTLIDSYGDGVCIDYQDTYCSQYSATVNGVVLLANERFDYRIDVKFITPSDSTGDPVLVETVSPSESPTLSSIPSSIPSKEPSAVPSLSNNPSSAPTACEGDILTVTILTDIFPADQLDIEMGKFEYRTEGNRNGTRI